MTDEYQDRGMKKWAGFYLSEHSAEQEKIEKTASRVNERKEQMAQQEIAAVLQTALTKNKQVAIQLEVVDSNGDYYDDVIGSLKGADSLGIYVSNKKVHYDEIRNIQIYDAVKWSGL